MFEQAYGFKKLIEYHQLTQDEVARRMSMSQSAVANKLRLLKLSYEEQRMILEMGLSERHARAMLRLSQTDARKEAICYVSEQKMNVQQTERYIEELLEAEKPSDSADPADERLVGFAFTDSEDEAMEVLRHLRRKMEAWRREGKDISMNIINGAKSLEIVLRLNK